MQRNFKCVRCPGRYRVGQNLIESIVEDSKMEDNILNEQKESMYSVWLCPKCTSANSTDWPMCGMCAATKPNEGIVSFRHDLPYTATL